MIEELVCSAVALVLYLNTLGADFCYDDSRVIKTNQDLLPETPWINIFYDDFWGTLLTHSGSHKSYRPLCTLSFRLNHALGGLQPWGYHLVNVSLHAAVTGLFARLSRLLLGGGRWALAAGLLFAAHPVHTEAVAGVVGRADLGAGLFFLLSLLCYARHCAFGPGPAPARCWAWLLASLLLAACSMLWKEQGVTVLGVAAAYDLFICHRLRLRPLIHLLRKRKNTSLVLRVSLLATWGAVLLALRLYWMGNKPPSFSNSDNPAADSPSLLTRTLTFLYLPAANLWLLLCPSTLSFDWSMDALPLLSSLSDWRNLHTLAFYCGFLLLAWAGLRDPAAVGEANGKAHATAHVTNGKPSANGHACHAPPEPTGAQNGTEARGPAAPRRPSLPATGNMAVFSLSLLCIPFLPASNLLFYVGFVMAERILYIPSMGFCLLLTVGLRSLSLRLRGRGRGRGLLLLATAALLLLHAAKTLLRNQDWRDEERLYRSGIPVNPAKAWGNLGNVLKNQGKVQEAEQAYRNALHYRGNMADMLYNLGLLLQENNQLSEALRYYRLAIGSRPTLASAYLNTGIILMNQGHLDEAKRTFLTCADIPDENLKDPHAHRSSVTSCLYNLGKLLHEQGHQEEALSVYKDAVQKMPRQFAPQSLYNMMGEAYMRLSKLDDAEHWYRESLRAKPDHIPAHLTYGKLLAIRGQKAEAERYFLKAIELDPRKGNCYMHYGQFLLEESRLVEAAAMAERAAELENGEFDVVFSAAHMLRQASLNEAAEKYYGMAAGLRPDYPAALMNLGAILHLNGKLREAESNYLRALRLKPHDVITQSNLRKLWNIMEKQGLKTAGP
ncbi:protein O-mannosyl-transferase TMTC2-like isoform X1 [Anguilla anguilla]|uniref:protein O-mannosyl-transferase TMTC2-like isoform X1 n=1 Tax=Anguilla anguilla TaxID=7936 RepID=UPI0015AA21C8|nr:protein O-mannosyl-transferase TMTC2-like isoform X1 [Anguilla anguilla]